MEKRKVLVCGATGFVGRNIAEHLAKLDDFEVYGTYLRSPPYNNPKINLQEHDLRDEASVKRAVKGMDIIVQMAATTSGAKDIVSRPYVHVTDNVVMNSLLFREAFEQKVSNFIFPSCSIMYSPSLIPLKEEDFNGNIFPAYFGAGWTKVYLEKMCEFYSRISKTKFTAFRHSNVYGSFDKFDLEKSHVFAATITKVMTAKEGDAITVWGTGEEERDLIYVSDIVDFVEKAIEKQQTPFELVNVGYGSSVSVGSLVKKIIEISGKNLRIEYDTSKPTIKTKLCLDTSKAEEIFSWKRKVSLDEGIIKTIQWYRENVVGQNE